MYDNKTVTALLNIIIKFFEVPIVTVAVPPNTVSNNYHDMNNENPA